MSRISEYQKESLERRRHYGAVSVTETSLSTNQGSEHVDDSVVTNDAISFQTDETDDEPSESKKANIDNVQEKTGFVKICCYYLYQNLATVVIVVLLSIIFALAGERASSKGEASELVENQRTADDINWRPCQIYANAYVGSVKVIQTSLGDPSVHLGEIPCLVHGHRNNFKLNIPHSTGKDPQWEWLFGSTGEDPIDYGRPSAEIEVQSENIIFADREPILGFGGAFTEATALNWQSLSESGKSAVMQLLFGKEGLGYSLGRVHINSCDFSVAPYSFDDIDGDFELKHFDTDVKHDVVSGMMEMMLQANNLARTEWAEEDHGMRLIASPWSPPAWMKKPTYVDEPDASHASNMNGSAEPNCLREGTGPDSKYAKAWALYFSKFISSYKNLGLDLFAITVQNEPEFPAPWEACAYSPDIEASFVANHLGPLMREDHPDVKLLIFDHNKDHAPHWDQAIMNQNNPASAFVDGTAIHWYAGGMDRLLDGAVGQPNMHRLVSDLKTLNAKPNHLILGSEACHCPSTGYAGGDLTVAWARAERYAHTILADLAAGSNGWVEWNLVLDAIGGPNHLGNMCDSPILAVPYRAYGKHNVSELPSFEHADYPFGPVAGDSRTREELNAQGFPAEYLDLGLVVQPMYYYMGHISRYVRPGSRPLQAIVDASEHGPAQRTFLHKLANNTTLSGGGINDLARNGVELTTWPCEGSTRQHWTVTNNGLIQVSGHDWLGVPTTSCIGKKPDQSFRGLTLTDCNEDAGEFLLKKVNESGQKNMVNFVVQNTKEPQGFDCLIVVPLAGDGGTYGSRGGAQVSIGDCKYSSAAWNFQEETGEISSQFFANDGGEVCLTTGWPFLQVGAFSTPNGEKGKSIIVLNEANEPANYVLRHGAKVFMSNSIPAHSIQTILYD